MSGIVEEAFKDSGISLKPNQLEVAFKKFSTFTGLVKREEGEDELPKDFGSFLANPDATVYADKTREQLKEIKKGNRTFQFAVGVKAEKFKDHRLLFTKLKTSDRKLENTIRVETKESLKLKKCTSGFAKIDESEKKTLVLEPTGKAIDGLAKKIAKHLKAYDCKPIFNKVDIKSQDGTLIESANVPEFVDTKALKQEIIKLQKLLDAFKKLDEQCDIIQAKAKLAKVSGDEVTTIIDEMKDRYVEEGFDVDKEFEKGKFDLTDTFNSIKDSLNVAKKAADASGRIKIDEN